MQKLRYIDLFAGIGGFRIALDSLGHQCVFSSEWDTEAQKVYKSNFKDKPYGDITKISNKDIPDHDILCAGFPCQPFSISGKQLGFNDTRGTLFYEIARIVKYHQPKFLFLENVANLIGHDNGRTLNTILHILESLNYNVRYQLLNSSLFGIPQSRKRVYFIGIRKDISKLVYDFPTHTFEKVSLKDILINHSATKHLVIKRTDININYNLLKDQRLLEFPYKPIRIGILNKGGQGERIYYEYGHSITLSAYGGGIGAKTGLYYIDGQVRKLHPEECKRLMTFPDDFIIHPNPNQAYKQFGNAVVVKVVERIFKKLMDDLECQQKSKIKELVLK